MATFGIKTRDVRSFEAIAVDAGKGKVRLFRGTAVLTSDDVIDLERRGVEYSG